MTETAAAKTEAATVALKRFLIVYLLIGGKILDK